MGLGGQLTFFSAATIHFLVRYISGVEMLEVKQKKKAEFHVYMAETNAFLPMPKRNLTEAERELIL